MIKAAIALFMIGAILGILILITPLNGLRKLLVFFHGAFVATGFLLVVIAFIQQNQPFLFLGLSLVFFTTAAIGGSILFLLDKKRKPFPLALVVFHPLFAACGIISLVLHFII